MGLSIGIVGLPNVGKSTLFNALIKRQAALSANYPFATIEPNVGVVEVKDERLLKLAEIIEHEANLKPKSVPIKYPTIEFVDIAGLVKGASKGEGLGNKFLANIRECNLICHVLRAFENPEIILTGEMNPVEDLKTVRTELMLTDIETISRARSAKSKDLKEKKIREDLFDKLINILNQEIMLNSVEFSPQELEYILPLCLLTMKKELFVINVSEDQLNTEVDYLDSLGISKSHVVKICAQVESDLSDLSEEEQNEYLIDLGLDKSGIEKMAMLAYNELNLTSYFTAGEIEVKAWTITKGMTAPQAAGVIHTDFEKNFIAAEVVAYTDYINAGGWQGAKEKGNLRLEGKNYVVKEGDVIIFKHN